MDLAATKLAGQEIFAALYAYALQHAASGFEPARGGHVGVAGAAGPRFL